MMLIAMAIGVAAVVVLTSLGEGARRYVTGEFQALGTDLLIVLPGRSETTGVQPGAVCRRDAARPDARRRAGAAAHPGRRAHRAAGDRLGPGLGARAVARGAGDRHDGGLPGYVRNLAIGAGPVPAAGRARPRHGRLRASAARCAPSCSRAGAAVGGVGAHRRPPLPRHRRARRLGARRRLRHAGARAHSGEQRTAAVQHRIAVPHPDPGARPRRDAARARPRCAQTLTARHQGEEDVTVITQDAVLATFDRIFTALTLTLAGIAVDQPRGGRHPDHERDAGRGEPAHRRSRPAQGARRAPRGRSPRCSSPRRSCCPSPGRGARAAARLCRQLASSAASIRRCRSARRCGRWCSRSLIAVASGVVFGLLPARRAARLDPVVALAGRR